jgi:hypothetical protein
MRSCIIVRVRSMRVDAEAAGRLEVYESKGRYWFRLVSARGEPLLLSTDYGDRDEALADVDRLRHPTTRFLSCVAPSGEFYFTADAWHGDRLAASTTYASSAERDDAQAVAVRLLQAGPTVLRVVEA